MDVALTAAEVVAVAFDVAAEVAAEVAVEVTQTNVVQAKVAQAEVEAMEVEEVMPQASRKRGRLTKSVTRKGRASAPSAPGKGKRGG